MINEVNKKGGGSRQLETLGPERRVWRDPATAFVRGSHISDFCSVRLFKVGGKTAMRYSNLNANIQNCRKLAALSHTFYSLS